jgi:hypothetical protein
VVYTHNNSSGGWLTVQGQSGQKVCERPFQPIAGVVVPTCHSSYTGGVNRRIVIQASLSINVRPH